MDERIFIIFAPPYDPNIGGIIALHNLCHILNGLGRRAYLFPYVAGLPVDLPLEMQLKMGFRVPNADIQRLEVNPAFQTPVISLENLSTIAQSDSFIIVYPEVVWGNPLNAKNVVRWFLHNPGHFSKKVYYGPRELYFRFGPETLPAIIPGSKLSESFLTVMRCPVDLYNLDGVAAVREGIAVCVRKGAGKKWVHSQENSVIIDGKPHQEVAQIFKRVKQLVSYDTRTYYSQLAVLCGCESIVIPDDGVSEEQWNPDPRKRYGLAYGFENIHKASATTALTLGWLLEDERNSEASVRNFVNEADSFFNR